MQSQTLWLTLLGHTAGLHSCIFRAGTASARSPLAASRCLRLRLRPAFVLALCILPHLQGPDEDVGWISRHDLVLCNQSRAPEHVSTRSNLEVMQCSMTICNVCIQMQRNTWWQCAVLADIVAHSPPNDSSARRGVQYAPARDAACEVMLKALRLSRNLMRHGRGGCVGAGRRRSLSWKVIQ